MSTLASTATLDDLMDQLITDLRALLSYSVEKWWRQEQPTVLTVYVHPEEELEEQARGIGNDFMTGWIVNCYVETPWDDKATTADTAQAVADSIRGWVNSNRSYVADTVLTCGRTPYGFVKREGTNKRTFLIKLPLRFRPPNRA